MLTSHSNVTPGIFLMRFLIILLSLSLAIAACSGNWSHYPSRSNTSNHQVKAIYPGDMITVSVFEEDALSGQYSVLPNGTIQMTLVGQIEVSGLSTERAAQEISKTLKEAGFLVNPSVTVSIDPTQTILIMGEVVGAGEFPFKDRMTILDAVGKAGGFSYRANQHSFDIVRKESNGLEKVVEANISTLLKPGDVIRVRERYF